MPAYVIYICKKLVLIHLALNTYEYIFFNDKYDIIIFVDSIIIFIFTLVRYVNDKLKNKYNIVIIIMTQDRSKSV